VDLLEKDGQGLNLTYEVRDGILNHQIKCTPATLEGKIVRLADKIAYIHHDMDDAIRADILTENDVPDDIRAVIGDTCTIRLDHFIHDIVSASYDQNAILMSEPVNEAMKKMRQFMFENVYTNPIAKAEEGKAVMMIEILYEYFVHHKDKMPHDMLNLIEAGEPLEKVVCDYISAMTDRFAIARFEEIYIPIGWQKI
jgi:dGTPase